METKFRFIKFDSSGRKWYAFSRGDYGLKRRHAVLFTEVDWIQWGEAAGWIKEPLGENIQAPTVEMLPGMGE